VVLVLADAEEDLRRQIVVRKPRMECPKKVASPVA